MQTVNEVCYLLSLAALAGCAALGIFSKHYPDTLVQRAGMVLVAFAGPISALQLVAERPSYNSIGLTLGGCAVYAVGTLIKRWRE